MKIGLVILAVSIAALPASANPRFYPTLSLRNFHCVPDGIQRVPKPDTSGDRYFLVPVYIYNEVDTSFNPNVGGQHLEPIRNFQFQFTYLTPMMVLDTAQAHGSPVMMTGPLLGDTVLAKSFSITYDDRQDISTGNPYLHRIRLAGAGITPLPLAMTPDSGCWERNGILLWLRFRVIESAINQGWISLDSALFEGHYGDSLLNPWG